uniref:Uncharacterized protein n=1 Tax=Acrobeloides nanus TaxID=290746 RepID=A0A914D604_9BILA
MQFYPTTNLQSLHLSLKIRAVMAHRKASSLHGQSNPGPNKVEYAWNAVNLDERRYMGMKWEFSRNDEDYMEY